MAISDWLEFKCKTRTGNRRVTFQTENGFWGLGKVAFEDCRPAECYSFLYFVDIVDMAFKTCIFQLLYLRPNDIIYSRTAPSLSAVMY